MADKSKGPGRYAHMGKLGWEELRAYWRQGLAELRAVFYGESRIAQPPDPAMPGVYSPGEAADIRREASRNMAQHKEPRDSVLAKYEPAKDPNRDEGPAVHQSRDDRGHHEPDIDRD